ncbi:MAG: hydratase, partial [Polaromonas sp.]|nr:hydratase [Polaromonas sp.]
LEERLAAAHITLSCGGRQVDEGVGSNVLDGPLHALQHFLMELRSCPGAPELQPGDVVTTGTWTDAWPVAPGETWTAAFDAPLAGLTVRFR